MVGGGGGRLGRTKGVETKMGVWGGGAGSGWMDGARETLDKSIWKSGWPQGGKVPGGVMG